MSPGSSSSSSSSDLSGSWDWVEPEDFFVSHVADRSRSFWLDGSGSKPWSGRMSYVGWLEDTDPSLTQHAATTTVTEYGRSAPRAVGSDIFQVLQTFAAHFSEKGSQAGWVGFFGYAARPDLPAQVDADPDAVDSCWMRASRFVAFDHQRQRVSVVCPPDEVEAYSQEVGTLLACTLLAPDLAATANATTTDTATATTTSSTTATATGGSNDKDPTSRIVSTCEPEEFASSFDGVQRQLRLGNSYETNLTFRTVVESVADPVDVYRRLRRLSPAPYAALITHQGTRLLSSSPERFVTINADRLIETRPIKGTTPRDLDPGQDEAAAQRLRDEPKFVGENLMIVDLLRNDLSRVCRIGSVQVTDLMHVESYPSVHQLISTIEGRLRPEVGTFSALKELFPGGSMTGAPKLRTMAIIADVESSPRGPYAGALGWILDDGTADLGITIRSLVHRGQRFVFGTGGGITVHSTCADEYAETSWKSHRLLAALGMTGATLEGATPFEPKVRVGRAEPPPQSEPSSTST